MRCRGKRLASQNQSPHEDECTHMDDQCKGAVAFEPKLCGGAAEFFLSHLGGYCWLHNRRRGFTIVIFRCYHGSLAL